MMEAKENIESTIFEGMDEKDIEKAVNKKVTIAKRLWTNSKVERVYTDKIEKTEVELFKGDKKLAKLVIIKEKIEQEIIDHIDYTLQKARDVNAKTD
jgi:hypothetical protein